MDQCLLLAPEDSPLPKPPHHSLLKNLPAKMSAAASAVTNKPAQPFLIPRSQKPTIRQQRRNGRSHNPQSPKDHEIPPEF